MKQFDALTVDKQFERVQVDFMNHHNHIGKKKTGIPCCFGVCMGGGWVEYKQQKKYVAIIRC